MDDVDQDPVGPVAAADRPEQVVEAREAAQRLAGALARLPDSQRTAFELLKQDGLTLAEAAAVLGVTVTAVKLRAHRAYESLRAALGEDVGSEVRLTRSTPATRTSSDASWRPCRAEPAPTQRAVRQRGWLTLGVCAAIALAIFAHFGGIRVSGRPGLLIVWTCLGWSVAASAAAALGVARGRSMLGRSTRSAGHADRRRYPSRSSHGRSGSRSCSVRR